MSKSKQKGTALETAVVKYLSANGYPNVERRALNGVNDKGDITGIPGLVIECKNVAKMNLAGWVDEAEVERVNDGAAIGVVWHKRKGRTDPGAYYVTMTGATFLKLMED
jgi:Holliday junction resolvase